VFKFADRHSCLSSSVQLLERGGYPSSPRIVSPGNVVEDLRRLAGFHGLDDDHCRLWGGDQLGLEGAWERDHHRQPDSVDPEVGDRGNRLEPPVLNRQTVASAIQHADPHGINI